MATVVGAILVVSIIVLALLTYRNSFVPVLEEEAEERFMDQVAQALLRVRGDVDAQVGRAVTGRLSTPVPNSQGGSIPGAPPRRDNVVSFRNLTRSVTVHADDATVWHRNGTSQVHVNRDWEAIVGGSVTVGAIDAVRNLRLRFASLSSAQAGDSVTVRVVSGGLQGLIEYSIEDTRAGGGGSPERSELVATVEDAAGDVVFDQTIATFTQSQTDYQVDVLNPLPGFDQVLAAVSPPFRLVFVENGMDAEHSMTFQARNTTSDATVTIPGGGEAVAAVHREFQGGVLEYRARNNFFVDQTYQIEHGALVLRQTRGATIRAGPQAPAGRVEAGLVDPRAQAGLRLPSLVGSNATIAGAGPISVATDASSSQGLRAVASEVHVNVTTASPEAWGSWTRDHYQGAGLAAGEFDVETGDDWMNVTVDGPSLLGTLDDVHLDLRRATVETTLER